MTRVIIPPVPEVYRNIYVTTRHFTEAKHAYIHLRIHIDTLDSKKSVYNN